jgi:hypothetical protein
MRAVPIWWLRCIQALELALRGQRVSMHSSNWVRGNSRSKPTVPNSEVTSRQQRFLFSKGSPLSAAKKKKLADEMRHGDVKVRKKVRKGHGLSRGRRKKKHHKLRT